MNKVSWKECLTLIKQDLQRYLGGAIRTFLSEESFQLTFWFRIASYLWHRKNTFYFPIYILVKFIYRHYEFKTGIQLPMGSNVGPGVRFFHHGCIVVAQTSRVGCNASIHQGVTIGRVFNGSKAGVPTIGDNVVIFAGAKIIGNIAIGDNAVIGANAVVTSDIPAFAVACGIPAKVVSQNSNHCFDKYWGKHYAHDYDLK